MKVETLLVTAGRDPIGQFGAVNPPVCRASTIIFPTVEEFENRGSRPGKQLTYGIHGTPTTYALEEALAKLEDGYDAKIFPSGLAAISVALMAYLEASDHLLMADSVYGPTRWFCDEVLSRFGVETTYYDPLIGSSIKNLMRPNTKVVYLESPGSLTFEIQDIPAISEVAKKFGVLTMIDNAWATPLYFKPFKHGVDVSIQPVTKYISGHSDVMLGAVITTKEAWPQLRKFVRYFGQIGSPDDCFLALRGLRTLAVRMERHQTTGLAIAEWLQDQPEVEKVLHPGLSSDPGHGIWKRDFIGASGLFGFYLKPCSWKALEHMVDRLNLFGIGYSWGGYESLIQPISQSELRQLRTKNKIKNKGPLLRIHAGLEDPDDLITDLQEGFRRL